MNSFSENDWLAQPGHYSQIEGNLWMGGSPGYDGQNGHRQFDFIVDLYGRDPYPIAAKQLRLVMQMTDSANMAHVPTLIAIADHIRNVRKIGPTLVHCEAGWNRSGLLTALSLIRDGWTPETAISTIRKKRCPECITNTTFHDWLMTLKPGA